MNTDPKFLSRERSHRKIVWENVGKRGKSRDDSKDQTRINTNEHEEERRFLQEVTKKTERVTSKSANERESMPGLKKLRTLRDTFGKGGTPVDCVDWRGLPRFGEGCFVFHHCDLSSFSLKQYPSNRSNLRLQIQKLQCRSPTKGGGAWG